MTAARRRRARPGPDHALGDEPAELPPKLQWREWMGVVEAVIFAASGPVSRGTLAGLVGPTCRLDDLIADIQDELRTRPYELIAVAGGWQHRTRPRFAAAIRSVRGEPDGAAALTPTENLVVTAIAYLQPVSRSGLSRLFGKEVGRDVLARLKRLGLVASGPRLPQIGAPATYVTTGEFLSVFGLNSLRELPEIEALEQVGLLDVAGVDVDSGSNELDHVLFSETDHKTLSPS